MTGFAPPPARYLLGDEETPPLHRGAAKAGQAGGSASRRSPHTSRSRRPCVAVSSGTGVCTGRAVSAPVTRTAAIDFAHGHAPPWPERRRGRGRTASAATSPRGHTACLVEQAATGRTVGIMPGCTWNWTPPPCRPAEAVRDDGLQVFEDAAQAHAGLHGTPVARSDTIGMFSLYRRRT